MKTNDATLTYQSAIAGASQALGSDLKAKAWFCSSMETGRADLPITLFRTGRHGELRSAIEALRAETEVEST